MFKKLISKILITVLVFAPVTGYCLPAGGQVVAGSATIKKTDASTMNINQRTDKAIINWAGFDIATGQTVNFIQLSASSVALNRIGGNASSIYGTLNANGRVFLINPNGILFAPGSQVNVGGLVASTLDIKNEDFLAGRYIFKGTGGSVVNQGNINLNKAGGYIALLGSSVSNAGAIIADLGSVVLATGSSLTLKLDPKGLISVTIDEATLNDLKQGTSTLKEKTNIALADNAVLLTPSILKRVFDQALNSKGITQATALTTTAAGNIELTGPIQAKQITLASSKDINIQGAGKIQTGEGGLTFNAAGTINANADITTAGDFTLLKGTFNSNIDKIFEVGRSFSLLNDSVFSRFGGSGMVDDPYQIRDVFGLQGMRCHLDSEFVLANDIDASGTRYWYYNNGVYQGFEPVGGYYYGVLKPFTGRLDGQNHSINGLYINRDNKDYVGLFGYTHMRGAFIQIQKLKLINCDIVGRDNVGGLAGYLGGAESRIRDCYVTGSIRGLNNVGGLVGHDHQPSILYCGFNGNVAGNEKVGGLIGLNSYYHVLMNSYAQGKVSGVNKVGGLVGENITQLWNPTYTFNCYASVNVNGTNDVGGLVGLEHGDSWTYYTANFWIQEDAVPYPRLKDIGNLGDVEGITAKSSLEMKQRSTFESAGWNFQTIWTIREGIIYPYLRWQISSVVRPPVAIDGIQNPVIPTAATGASLSTDLKKKNILL